MSYKIAIIHGGLITKSFNDLYRVKNNLLKILNPDIYVYTQVGEPVGELVNALNDWKVYVKLENQISFQDECKQLKTNVECLGSPENVFHMWHKRKKAFEMLLDDYDFIISMRLDAQYLEYFDYSVLSRIKNQLAIPGIDLYGNYGDVFAVGRPEQMKIYFNMINKLLEYYEEGCKFHPETLLGYHFKKNNLSVIRFPMKIAIRNYAYNFR